MMNTFPNTNNVQCQVHKYKNVDNLNDEYDAKDNDEYILLYK